MFSRAPRRPDDAADCSNGADHDHAAYRHLAHVHHAVHDRVGVDGLGVLVVRDMRVAVEARRVLGRSCGVPACGMLLPVFLFLRV